MDSTYSGNYGRIKSHETDFLHFDFITDLLNLKSIDDVTNELTKTGYSEDISALSSTYKNPDRPLLAQFYDFFPLFCFYFSHNIIYGELWVKFQGFQDQLL